MADVNAPRRLATALWLGQLVSEELLHSSPAVGVAANRWQLGLLRALHGEGMEMRVRGCTPQPAWPRGPVRAGAHEGAAADRSVKWSMEGYLNLPLVKLRTQHRQLLRAVRREIRSAGPPQVAFSYNAGLPEAFTARDLQREQGIPWVCCVADFPIVSQSDIGAARRALTAAYAERQREWVAEAAGRIYLPWVLYQNDPGKRKFYLEGGVNQIHPPAWRADDGSPPVMMFAGSLGAWTGIDLLLEALPFIRAPFELWISGRGALAERVEAAAARDSRIRYLGLVSQQELASRMSRVDLFVNPRPSAVEDNRYNFPSKLLEYLAWCRPVVSTLTPGIPPHYLDVLTPVREETPQGLGAVLEEVLQRSPRERLGLGDRIHSFVEENLLWSVQARRLRDWLEAEGMVLAA